MARFRRIFREARGRVQRTEAFPRAGFKKPFRAQPVVLGAYPRAQDRLELRRARRRSFYLAAVGAVVVFLAGMAVTNGDKLPRFYPDCSWARVMDAAPINRGEPGYRTKLDADNDGVACESYPAP